MERGTTKSSNETKTTTLQIRLEDDVRTALNRYAQFLDANPCYVVSEALKLLFKTDQEFNRWLSQHKKNDGQDQEAVLTKAACRT